MLKNNVTRVRRRRVRRGVGGLSFTATVWPMDPIRGVAGDLTPADAGAGRDGRAGRAAEAERLLRRQRG